MHEDRDDRTDAPASGGAPASGRVPAGGSTPATGHAPASASAPTTDEATPDRAGVSRRGFLAVGAGAGVSAIAAWPAVAAARAPHMSAHARPNAHAAAASGDVTYTPTADRDRIGYVMPTLAVDGFAQLATLYESALTNVFGFNAVYADPASYDQAGLISYPPGSVEQAGGGYPPPQRWTRDAAVNAWNGLSALSPVLARNTLYAVLDPQSSGGGYIVQQGDNEWWDQVVWIVGAYNHFLATGDGHFLAIAHQASAATMSAREAANFDPGYGLFQGPGFMDDGIAGYPSPPWQPGINSSFVLDYPGAAQLMCLSSNCIYHGAYLALAEMAALTGDRRGSAGYRARAAQLRGAINRHFWIASAGNYGYLIHGDDSLTGQLDASQEGGGLAMAVLLGVADPRRAAQLLDSAHWQPHGIVNVWPSFARFSDAQPGRHNVMVWPMINGMFGHAAALGGRVDLFARTVSDMAALVAGSDNSFYELYNSVSGAVDGGWQTGGAGTLDHNTSQPDQAWSASAYLRLIHNGLFGVGYSTDALTLSPTLPPGWGTATLTGFPYRSMTLDITLRGGGNRVRRATVDGHPTRQASLSAHLSGHHRVEIELG
jgi:hypothetical protein